MRAANADLDYRIRILRNSPLFGSAAEDDIAELARVSKVIAVERGKPLVPRGQEGAFILAIHSGVGGEIHIEHGDDRPILVRLHGPGDVGGIVCAVLRGSPESRTAPAMRRIDALSNMTVLSAPAADFLRLCRRSPELSANLVRILADQNASLARVYARSTYSTLEMRLANFFNRLVQLTAEEDWNPVINVGKLSQSSIATMLGVSREHVNRTIAMWERSGLIFLHKNGDFLIQNARRLSQLAMTDAERGAPDGQDDRLAQIDTHLDRGLNQTAQHLALEAAKRTPRDKRYLHRAVLATARLGAISEALKLIKRWKIAEQPTDEETACLRPRLLRDLAYMRDRHTPDRGLLRESAEEYEQIFASGHGYFSGVNAAGGYALIGELDKAQEIAREVSGIIAETAADECDDYGRRTTLAECKLLLGDTAGAASLFEAASFSDNATPGKKATTRKQLRRLSDCTNIDEDWINRVTPQSGVVFYSGPAIGAVSDDLTLPSKRIVNAVSDLLSARRIRWAYGALASGADIVIAEALIKAGVDLNVYLPLPPQDFLESSVCSAGPEWRERFVACMRAAASIEWIRRAPSACDSAYKLGAKIAMGKALRHAAQLETEATGFFALQTDPDAAHSLSASNAKLWRANAWPMIEVRNPWPQAAARRDASSDRDDVLFYALVVQQDPAAHSPAIACDFHAASPDNHLDIFLFTSLERALENARAVISSKASASATCWLDAGVFSKTAIEKEPGEAAGRLITSACQPVTEPGKVFASEAFACSAELNPSLPASFDYLGFPPTREKLNPCALYLVRF